MKVGDKIIIQFLRYTSLGGTVLPPFTIQGKIIEDKGDHWFIELSLSFDGKNRVFIPKCAGAPALVEGEIIKRSGCAS